MKALLKLITTCLIILVLLSPALVIWKVWRFHSEFVQAHQTVLSNDYTIPDLAIPDLAIPDLAIPDLAIPDDITPDFVNLSSSSSERLPTIDSQQSFGSISEASLNLSADLSSIIFTSAALGFLISLPLGFYIGILLNKHHRSQRHTELRQQVATLERIWQQSLS